MAWPALAWARVQQPYVPFYPGLPARWAKRRRWIAVLRGRDRLRAQATARPVGAGPCLRALTEAEEHRKRREAEGGRCGRAREEVPGVSSKAPRTPSWTLEPPSWKFHLRKTRPAVKNVSGRRTRRNLFLTGPLGTVSRAASRTGARSVEKFKETIETGPWRKGLPTFSSGRIGGSARGVPRRRPSGSDGAEGERW